MASTIIKTEPLLVTLVSSASADVHATNTNTSFVNQFASQLSFDTAYHVVLQDIFFHATTRKKNQPKGDRLQPAILAPADNAKPRIMCCYCSIVEPVIIANRYSPLLAIISLNTDTTQCFTEPLPHRLVVHRFSEISIQLTDGDGYAFPLLGAVIVRLRFTRV